MLTVLMIDDNPDVIATVKDHLTSTVVDLVFHEAQDFAQGVQTLRTVRPDILVLDWYRGNPVTGDAEGANALEVVWNEWFCPVVIYSAGQVDLTEQPENHPFIRIVAKGANTEQMISAHITGYLPHVTALRDVGEGISRVTHAVLRDLAVPVFDAEQDENRRQEMLTRAARRRVAAMMDDASCFGGELAHAWEMYVFPVLTSHAITGDILRRSAGDQNNPESYRLVVTPTCDMVPHGAPPACKIINALAIRCCAPTHFAERGMNLARGAKPNNDFKKKLRSALNEAHQSGFVLLPECPGSIPMLGANLRDLELIPVASIGNSSADGKEYVRIASLDSPFREQFSWAYLQVACRPGLPPRDMASLIESFSALWAQPSTDGQQ